MASTPSTSVQSAATSGRLKSAKHPAYAVTLFNSRGASLFELPLLAGFEPDAVARALSAYGVVLVGLGDLRALTGEDSNLTVDPARTLVTPALTPGSIRLTYFVRIVGESRPDEHLRRLHKDDAIALLRSVAEADRSLLRGLTEARTFDLCPAYTWSPSSGWLTIDSCFRAIDAVGRMRALHPASPALRLAAELIVLRLLLGLQETVRQPLAQRWRLASHLIPSATLRAFHRATRPRSPESLIAWLRDRGHHCLAAALVEDFGR